MGFPKGFLWGGSISAAQIEGGWLDKLPAGVWYVAAETDRKGRYIEELEQWEHFGSQFVFCMIKEEAA